MDWILVVLGVVVLGLSVASHMRHSSLVVAAESRELSDWERLMVARTHAIRVAGPVGGLALIAAGLAG